MCAVKQRPNYVGDGATLCRRAGSSHTGSEHIWGRGRRSAKCSPPNVFVQKRVTMTGTRPRHTVMTHARIVALAFASLFSCQAARSQTTFSDDRPRLLLDSQIGSESALGYKFPSLSVGPSLELPLKNRFELQAAASYSPDKKLITNNGHLADVTASALGFVNQRVGFIAGVERGWLWTSEFDKKALFPSAGIVLRNDYFGPGRFYVSYVFPTGRVWDTTNNPVVLQSNRLQGITLRQESRSHSHMRWGVESGLYRFCNEANPNEPQASQACRLGVSALATFSFEFHLGGKSRFSAPSAIDSDNF
jgi:hypothetical protein